MPSEYNTDFDATGNDMPVPDTVLNVNVYLLADRLVASSTTYTLSIAVSYTHLTLPTKA